MCKVCNSVSPIHPRHSFISGHWCPYCNTQLRVYKERSQFTIYKCYNNNCSLYIKNKKKLNFGEQMLYKIKPFEFKLHYQHREYLFSNEQLIHSAPKNKGSITNVRNSLNTICLILTFHVSFAISARKTAYLLRQVFKIKLSPQSVINYCEMAAFYCHKFNLKFKGPVDKTQAGDETYIKINGKTHYTFFFVSAKQLKITAYHLDTTRDTLGAVITIKEAIRTADPKLRIFLISDGNPAYLNAIHYLNKRLPELKHKIKLKNVTGIQNLDTISTTYRPFKQLIERLNRTYKFHLRAASGFSSKNGAVSLTTLFVTFYNFMRPHMSLNYKVPIPLDFLQGIDTIQGRWAALLGQAIAL